MSDSEPLNLFSQARDRFLRTAAVLSGLSLAGEAVSLILDRAQFVQGFVSPSATRAASGAYSSRGW
jgi:hypothetical protein